MDSLQARLTEHSTVWDRMRDCRKPVLLYGMGNGAQKLLDECARRGIEVAGVFASDEFVRGHSFAGYPVLRYREARARFGDFFTAIAFASQRPEVLAQFYAVEREGETAAPDLPVAGCSTADTCASTCPRSSGRSPCWRTSPLAAPLRRWSTTS